jgi:hypothetical protein
LTQEFEGQAIDKGLFLWYNVGTRRVQMQGLDAVFRFRLPSELLQAAKEKARREDVTLAQVLRRQREDN